MLAHLVERSTGQPFPDYVSANIFTPLGMTRSSFHQPYPADLTRDLAVGYIDLFGRYLPQGGSYTHVYPASGLITTGADMGRFMLAHLEDGRLGDGQILRPETVREMHSQQFTQHPGVSGLAYGFWEQVTHGRRALLHSGEGLGFASELFLLPDERTGFFIATNRRAFGLHNAFTTAFLDRYFPAPTGVDAVPQPLHGSAERAARYAGIYQFFRFDQRMVEKVNVEEVVITANANGTLSTSFAAGRWVEVEPLLFHQVDGDGRMAFREDSAGRITDLYTDHWPWAYRKGHWYNGSLLRYILLGSAVFVLLSAVVAWPFRRRQGWAWHAAGLTGLLSLSVLGLLAPTLVVDLQGGDMATLYGMPPALVTAFFLGLVIPAPGLVVAGWSVFAWKRGVWSLGGRIHYSLIALAGAAFLWSLAYLNMIGFHY